MNFEQYGIGGIKLGSRIYPISEICARDQAAEIFQSAQDLYCVEKRVYVPSPHHPAPEMCLLCVHAGAPGRMHLVVHEDDTQ